MPAATQSHARSHALLLLQKLLNLRDNASPLTLVLDTIEQSGKPIVREFLLRGKIAKSKTIFVSFESLRKPAHADVQITAWGKSPEALCAEVVSHYASATKVLVIIDALNPLAATYSSSLPAILGSLLRTPAISIVGVYHTDVPLSPSFSSSSSSSDGDNPYGPEPLTLLMHLATAVLTASSLHQTLERKRARDRSLQEPEFGIREGREGVLVGLRPRQHPQSGSGSSSGGGGVGGGGGERDLQLQSSRQGGLVLNMELRRRSGRSVSETFVFVPGPLAVAASTPQTPIAQAAAQPNSLLAGTGRIMLLADHPLFNTVMGGGREGHGDGTGDDGAEQPESTFNLGLTDKQRQDREGIVLPYFDAQTDIGAGEGGRILYEMGREDDFDDEEDEI